MCEFSKSDEGGINMSIILRIELIVLALVFVALVFNAVNKRKLWLQYSLIWLLLSGGLLVTAFFPSVLDWLAHFMQIEVTSNLVYLIAIFVLVVITFYLTKIVSKQSEQIKTLIQVCSIERYMSENREKECGE